MILLRVLAFFVFALAFIHGITVVVRWWQGQILEIWEYALLAVFPILLYLFVSRYSIFRKDCQACQWPVDKHD